MASDMSSPAGGLDERLAQARDSVLQDGEEIIAQAMGDQGQAIVVTGSRILIIKAGLTATGTLNGKQISDFPVDNITGVNVRKGPMGAVIQVCTDTPQQSGQGSAPHNIIVFTGAQRVKKCEALANKIESALGKSVTRIPADDVQAAAVQADAPAVERPVVEEVQPEPVQMVEAAPVEEVAPKASRGGRQPISLAEEMFAEMNEWKPEPVAPPAPVLQEAEVTLPTPEPVVEQVMIAEEAATPQPEPVEEPEVEEPATFRPNPRLPKPIGARRTGPNKMLVVFGALMALLLICMAIMAPLRGREQRHVTELNVGKITRSPVVLRQQITTVTDYREQVLRILSASNQEATGVVTALKSGSSQAVSNAIRRNESDAAWRKLMALEAPPGLAGIKETLVSGAFARKNAVAEASASGMQDAGRIVAELRKGDAMIGKGMDGIQKMLADFRNQLAEQSK